MKIYQQIATSLTAAENCKRSGISDWLDRHIKTIDRIMSDAMPSGGGIDAGTKFDWKRSKPNKLVFLTSYHHMSEHGYYDGWTEHSVIITPDLASGYAITVTGRDRNDIKEYLADTFANTLDADYQQPGARHAERA